jgi:chemotaxis protein methyltransferase CheR
MSAGAASRADDEDEFPFTEDDFRFIAGLVKEVTGIVLGDHKRAMVYGRLARRLRALGLKSFAAYRELLQSKSGAGEIVGLTNAITTNLTKFFRESHHFDHLRDTAIAEWKAEKSGPGKRRLRIWSAGCSTGEEPYSIAMTVAATLGNMNAYDVRILATDLDTNVLDKAKRGIYSKESVELVPAALRTKYCEPIEDAGGRDVSMAEGIRKPITFKQLNLLGSWPMKGPFDVIFCRNVLIYFDGPTKSELIRRYKDMLKPGGWLYIGHSESVVGGFPGLSMGGRTTYRKVG